MEQWKNGHEGCDTAYDLGWKHGTEDIHDPFKYRPGYRMTPDDFDEYKEGYKEARRGWD